MARLAARIRSTNLELLADHEDEVPTNELAPAAMFDDPIDLDALGGEQGFGIAARGRHVCEL